MRPGEYKLKAPSGKTSGSTRIYYDDLKPHAATSIGSTSYAYDDNGNLTTRWTKKLLGCGIQGQLLKYYPFGVCLQSQGEIGTDKLFTGQRLDETGLYYYGARYYDATIGRFISADKNGRFAQDPQSLNEYTYCRNNPLNRVDPTGHTWITALAGLAIGGLVGLTKYAIYDQLIKHQQFSWRELGGDIAAGAITGAVAGLTLGASLLATAAAGAAANATATVTNDLISGHTNEITPLNVGIAAGVGGVFAGVGAGLASSLKGLPECALEGIKATATDPELNNVLSGLIVGSIQSITESATGAYDFSSRQDCKHGTYWFEFDNDGNYIEHYDFA